MRLLASSRLRLSSRSNLRDAASVWGSVFFGQVDDVGLPFPLVEGRVTAHHRFLLQQLYDHLLFTESKRKQIEEEMKNNYLSALYRRIAARRGAKRAVMAVAHTLLEIAYHMLKRKEDYRELGADHFDRIDVNRTRRSLVRPLERLGHKVTLEPLALTA